MSNGRRLRPRSLQPPRPPWRQTLLSRLAHYLKFVPVVFEGVLATPQLARHTSWCLCISAVLECNAQDEVEGPWRAPVSAQKLLQGFEIKMRELQRGTDKNSVSPTRGLDFFANGKKWVSGRTWWQVDGPQVETETSGDGTETSSDGGTPGRVTSTLGATHTAKGVLEFLLEPRVLCNYIDFKSLLHFSGDQLFLR